ncbi:12367_t:CDS:1, partial [Funneliformis caledonium]
SYIQVKELPNLENYRIKINTSFNSNDVLLDFKDEVELELPPLTNTSPLDSPFIEDRTLIFDTLYKM